MSHSGMSLEQAKEMQKRYGGRVISIGFPEDRRSTWHPSTDEDFGLQADSLDAVSMAHILLSRSKHTTREHLTPVVAKNRTVKGGLEEVTIRHFER